MPESFKNACNRLKGVEKKCKANPSYAVRYTERINHLLENDYAYELKDDKVTSKTWYLPHFGVDNPNKNKLRLVFDAAAKSNGYSLNDYLMTGPDLLTSLYGIMLRFRENKIAVTGDIRDMFLRIKIIPEDQHALRFLWKRPGGSQGDVKTYSMSSLIFGANCSPFIAQFIKNKNAKLYESSKPRAVQAICKQHYADDYIDSLEDSTTAIQLIKDIAHIHKQGGFEIRNWTSNCEEVLNSLPKQTLCSNAVRFKVGQQDVGERILGLIWYPKDDELGFDVSFKRIPENIINGLKRPTKREMLRLIMSIFDVYGFLSPFTVKAKIMLQEIWKTNLDWDDEIPDTVHAKWTNWLQQLKYVNNVRLPRCYHASVTVSEMAVVAPNSERPSGHRSSTTVTENRHNVSAYASSYGLYTNLQLHIFCDASTQAMCAVAYWRWVNKAGKIQIAFISSKCRVAPIKHTSVPRLELQAAVLGARLAETVVKEHKIGPHEKYYWSDSSTVLHWIRNHARDYKPYVAHRLGEIDELSSATDWHYIPTSMNVADIATRDSCDVKILQNEWLYGPEFLYQESHTWPEDIPGEVCSEILERVTLLCDASPSIPDAERFSSWLRLLKTTCVVLSFIDKCKKLSGDIDGDMMRRAERLLIVYSQSQSFAEDLQHLKNKKRLESKSKLLTLSPYVDEYGILRVGGRIDSALGISSETKNPVILDGRNYITKLIVRYYHVKAAHGNRETVVNNLKQKYWVIRMRPTIKHITSQCMYCRIKKTRPQPPRMGDLPSARMAHHQRPFTYCGVDLFGPMEVAVGRRRERRYGVLFTCMTIRAIHIELVSDLSTDAFIMALRRMAARRGWPQYLYSDNGTNLRGADNELKRSVKELDEAVLKQEAANYHTTWIFSPPASPHWGGAWERLIRSVKESLKVVLKERAPRDEILSTLMAEVEQMVNSRPLTHVSVEPHTDESLTPNHFLLHSSSNSPCIGVFDESDTYLRKQWRISQRLADLFWKRWVREVLPDMRPRTKWHQDHRPLQVGDLVLIVDPNSPRNVWPRGKIEKVMPGQDGRVRVVDVRTKSGLLRRSATRVALIPTEK
ncbi:hypothetical protein K1T71_013203 [Dendrolimus kikuchii]|uniref:Uncharacterized protein n=1 Tax=Dendrolimus kikuchii TaxID=765133 RepID=A0ACC1CHF8_9NEOP|nr:hypothetical protein K1T71_013203 [Dendrolimus kikuchii]